MEFPCEGFAIFGVGLEAWGLKPLLELRVVCVGLLGRKITLDASRCSLCFVLHHPNMEPMYAACNRTRVPAGLLCNLDFNPASYLPGLEQPNPI